MELILYTTHCPKCSVLEKKLAKKGLNYTEFTSIPEMIALGISSVPVLSVDGELLPFEKANQWINSVEV